MDGMTLSTLALGGMILAGLAALALLMVALAAARQKRVAAKPLAFLLLCLLALGGLEVVRRHDLAVEACATNLRWLGAALELWVRNDGEPPANLELLVPVYFTTLPECPSAPGSYLQGYEHAEAGFTVVCRGRHHDGLGGAPEDYPRFTSTMGLQSRP